MFQHIINSIGFHGPELLFILSIYWLYNKANYFNVYLIGFVMNFIFSYILKGVFKQPRPTDEQHLFAIEKIYRKNMSFERYGMPSCHAQMVFYSTGFVYLVLQDCYITGGYLLVSLLTLYQRVASSHHFVSQIIVGALLGLLVAWVFYKYGTKLVTGKLKHKRDDNGPI